MQLTFDADVEAFRAEFIAFLDEHLPADLEALDRSRSSSDVPDWARRWQRLMFDNGWLMPGYPPEFGGRNATILQQYVHQEELARRRCYLTFNPQGVGIISASLISFGTPEQQQRFLQPLVAGQSRSCFAMTEPECAGSNPVWMKTTAVRDGDDYVINGHKWFTSSADGAAFAIVMAVTNPGGEPHSRASQILVPLDTPGFRIVRNIPVMGHAGDGWMSHSEVRFENCRVPRSTTTDANVRGSTRPMQVARAVSLTERKAPKALSESSRGTATSIVPSLATWIGSSPSISQAPRTSAVTGSSLSRTTSVFPHASAHSCRTAPSPPRVASRADLTGMFSRCSAA